MTHTLDDTQWTALSTAQAELAAILGSPADVPPIVVPPVIVPPIVPPMPPVVTPPNAGTPDVWQWDGTLRSAYHIGSGHPGAVSIVPDPTGAPGNVLRLQVADSDRVDGNHNPAATFLTPRSFVPGQDRFITWSTLLEAGFPLIDRSKGHWFQVGEIYGPPYGGAAPIGIDVSTPPGGGAANHICLFRRGAPYDMLWSSPVEQYGSWYRLDLHVLFATDNTGFVEVTFNGQPQKFADGSSRFHLPTLAPGVNWDGGTPDNIELSAYHGAGQVSGAPINVYFKDIAVGTTLAKVS